MGANNFTMENYDLMHQLYQEIIIFNATKAGPQLKWFMLLMQFPSNDF